MSYPILWCTLVRSGAGGPVPRTKRRDGSRPMRGVGALWRWSGRLGNEGDRRGEKRSDLVQFTEERNNNSASVHFYYSCFQVEHD